MLSMQTMDCHILDTWPMPYSNFMKKQFRLKRYATTYTVLIVSMLNICLSGSLEMRRFIHWSCLKAVCIVGLYFKWETIMFSLHIDENWLFGVGKQKGFMLCHKRATGNRQKASWKVEKFHSQTTRNVSTRHPGWHRLEDKVLAWSGKDSNIDWALWFGLPTLL